VPRSRTPSPRRAAEAWIWRAAAPARRRLLSGLGLSAASALIAIPQDLWLARLLDGAGFHGAGWEAIGPGLAALAALIALRLGVQAGGEGLCASAAARVIGALRARLAAARIAQGPARLGDAGAFATTWLEATAALGPYLARVLPQSVIAATLTPAVLIAVFWLDPLSGALLLISAPLIPLFMALIGRQAEAMNRARWQSLAALGGALLDLVAGIATLRLFNRAEREVEALGGVAEAYRAATRSSLRVAFLSGAVLEFFAALGVALVAVLLGVRLLSARKGYFASLAILLLVPEFFAALRAWSALYHPRLAALTAAERLTERLTEPLAGENAPAAVPPVIPTPSPLPALPAPIACRGLLLRGEGTHPRLDLPELDLPSGAITAIIGPSGAGKTTLLWLLLRFLEPDAGEIRIGATPLAALDPESWRRRIAYLPQHPRLFAGPLGATLRRGRAEADEGALAAALEDADAAALIARLPEGLASVIGAGAIPFSRGEIQRLALARAFLKDAPYLFLDEPTAHLDEATETRVLAGIRRRSAGRSVLLVTHRPAALALADHVVMLDGGRVVAAGPAAALRETHPFCRRLLAEMNAPWASFAV